MGCTPSIHVSHTGVVYCRDNEEAVNSTQGTLTTTTTTTTSTAAAAATAVHVSTRSGPGRSSGRGHKEKQLAIVSSSASSTVVCTSLVDPPCAAVAVDSVSDVVGCRRGDGGRLSVTLSEAETQTSRQSMKVKCLDFQSVSIDLMWFQCLL
ncbi:phosphodiesterase [Elysia marginata]|uniref:Phosphodiesterase n=1 Tax=Elysia marginata TaxID=1093978 RepID=A0AAV4HIH3_9GAST|nr:phosphodiesterase [Elysia marginata]